MPRWLLPLLGLAALGLLAWWFLPSAPTTTPEVRVPTVTRAPAADSRPAVVPEAVKSLFPDVTKFTTELTDTFGKLTEALTSVKDAASAEATVLKLRDVEGKLDDAKTTMKELGDAGQTTIKTMVKTTLVKLRELVDKVLAIPGVGEKFKTVVASIMAKLTGLAG